MTVEQQFSAAVVALLAAHQGGAELMARRTRSEGYDDDHPSAYTVGQAEVEAAGGAEDDQYPIAMLWLPDCETKRGWAMRRVKRPPSLKPPRRVGFGRR